MAELAALLDHVRGSMSCTFVLPGEAEIGKRALLNATVELLQDFLVIG